MAEVMIARGSARVTVDGREEWVRRDRTTAHSDHPVVRNNPDLWRVLPVNFPSPAPDRPPAVEVELTDDQGAEPVPVEGHPPKAADVRAWAKANGIEGVPARGKIPDDIVARYLEAQAAADAGGGDEG